MHGLTNKYIMSPVEDHVVSDIYVLKPFLGQTKLKKVSGPPAWSIFCQVKHTDIQIQTAMLLNMHKNLHNRSHKL